MLPLTPLYSLSVLLPDRTEMGWPSHITEVAMTTQYHYVTLRAFLTQHTGWREAPGLGGHSFCMSGHSCGALQTHSIADPEALMVMSTSP